MEFAMHAGHLLDPAQIQRNIAERFNLFGTNLSKLLMVDDKEVPRKSTAEKMGLTHMSDIAPFLPAVPTHQVKPTIASYCKVREDSNKVYGLVFRLPKDVPVASHLSLAGKVAWLKEKAGITSKDTGKYTIRTIGLPATPTHPVVVVFCEDLAERLHEKAGMKLLQMQVSYTPEELALSMQKH